MTERRIDGPTGDVRQRPRHGILDRMLAAHFDDEADQLVEFVIGHDQHSVLRTQRSVSKLSRALTLLGRRNVDVTRSWFGARSNSEPAAGFRGPPRAREPRAGRA